MMMMMMMISEWNLPLGHNALPFYERWQGFFCVPPNIETQCDTTAFGSPVLKYLRPTRGPKINPFFRQAPKLVGYNHGHRNVASIRVRQKWGERALYHKKDIIYSGKRSLNFMLCHVDCVMCGFDTCPIQPGLFYLQVISLLEIFRQPTYTS